MINILATNDPVLLSFVREVLSEHGIEALILDNHTSVVEGSLGIIPRRVMVTERDAGRARAALADAGVGHELISEA